MRDAHFQKPNSPARMRLLTILRSNAIFDCTICVFPTSTTPLAHASKSVHPSQLCPRLQIHIRKVTLLGLDAANSASHCIMFSLAFCIQVFPLANLCVLNPAALWVAPICEIPNHCHTRPEHRPCQREHISNVIYVFTVFTCPWNNPVWVTGAINPVWFELQRHDIETAWEGIRVDTHAGFRDLITESQKKTKQI